MASKGRPIRTVAACFSDKTYLDKGNDFGATLGSSDHQDIFRITQDLCVGRIRVDRRKSQARNGE